MATLRTASSRASATNVVCRIPAVKGLASVLRNCGEAGSWGCVATGLLNTNDTITVLNLRQL